MGMRLESVRAKIGATILDVFKPGWARSINLKRLDLSDCSACVLGQTFGDFGKGAETLFAMRRTNDGLFGYDPGAMQAAREAGFEVDVSVRSRLTRSAYSNLTVAWKREIAARLRKRAS